jgi:hypothetical protein
MRKRAVATYALAAGEAAAIAIGGTIELDAHPPVCPGRAFRRNTISSRLPAPSKKLRHVATMGSSSHSSLPRSARRVSVHELPAPLEKIESVDTVRLGHCITSSSM